MNATHSIGRKLVTLFAVGTLSVLSVTKSASALTYVSLNDDGPVSIAPGTRNVPQDPPATINNNVPVNPFIEYYNNILRWRQQAATTANQQVAALDAQIEQWRAWRANCYHAYNQTRSQQAYNSVLHAQAGIQKLQEQRFAILDRYFTDGVNVMMTVYQADPNRQTNRNFYANEIHTLRTAHQNAVNHYRTTYGLPGSW